MSPQEAAELLDALKEHHSIIPATHKAMSLAVAALEREAKAEPVAWAYLDPDGECGQIEWGPVCDPYVTPLYASPPQNRPVSQVRDISEGWVMVPRVIKTEYGAGDPFADWVMGNSRHAAWEELIRVADEALNAKTPPAL